MFSWQNLLEMIYLVLITIQHSETIFLIPSASVISLFEPLQLPFFLHTPLLSELLF